MLIYCGATRDGSQASFNSAFTLRTGSHEHSTFITPAPTDAGAGPAYTPRRLQSENAEMRILLQTGGAQPSAALPWADRGDGPPSASKPSAPSQERTAGPLLPTHHDRHDRENRKGQAVIKDKRNTSPGQKQARKARGQRGQSSALLGSGSAIRERRQLATCRNTRCWLGIPARPEACGQTLGRQGLPAGVRGGLKPPPSRAWGCGSEELAASRAPGARPAASPSGL